jgi:hypothetical protein
LGVGSQIYTDLYNWLSAAQASGTEVDLGVLDWLAGAKDVNSGVGFNAQLIDDYSSYIYQIRSGTSLSASVLQQASNNIAISLASDVIRRNGSIPGIIGLGVDDAGATASGVFAGVYSPWAGTALFPYLGGGQLYQDWLLNMDTVDSTITDPVTGVPENVTLKSVDGTYDLVASLEAFQKTAGTLSGTDPSGSLANYFYQVLGLSVPVTNLSALQASIPAFFDSVYGLTSGQVPGREPHSM